MSTTQTGTPFGQDVNYEQDGNRHNLEFDADVNPNRNLTVVMTFDNDNGDTETSSTESVSTEVTVTSDVVAETDGNDDPQNAKRIYQGAPIAIQSDQSGSGTDIFLNATGQDLSTGSSSQFLTLDSTDSQFTTGEIVRAEFDGDSSNNESFTIRNLAWSASTSDTSVDDDSEIDVDVSANRGGEDLFAEMENDAGDVVATRDTSLDGDGSSTLTFNASSNSDINADDGPYTVTVTDNKTNNSATTDEITVTEAASGSVSLNQTLYDEERGDVAKIGISMSNTDTATVTIGNTGDNNWAQNVTVEDGNDDDFVTLEFNTYTAGADDDTYLNSGNNYVVYTVANDDDSVENVATANGSFDPENDAGNSLSAPANNTLAASDYSISAVSGDTAASETDDGEDAAATLSLQETSTNSVTNYVAPDSKKSDLDSVSAVSDAVSNDNVTEASEIANKDILIVKVDASGLEGVIQNQTDEQSANETAAFFNESQDNANKNAWAFFMNETNPGANANAYSASLNASNTDLLSQESANNYWLVIDTAQVDEFSDGDELETNFTTNDNSNDDLFGEDVTVTDNWEFANATAEVDANADVDDDGSADEVTVQKAAGQEITGTTNVAPSTELSVKVTGTDSGSPFVKPLNAIVQPDGTWSATADFSGDAQGANFTVDVKRGSTQLVDDKVDGRIAAAPTASVTFNDQESFGSTVTVSSVTMSDGGHVAIHLNNASGTVIGNSSYLDSGTHSDVEITLNQTLSEDSTLVAMPHQDTNGNEEYEFQFGSSVDAPYTDNGSAVTDSASITVASPVTTTTDTGTETDVTTTDTGTETDMTTTDMTTTDMTTTDMDMTTTDMDTETDMETTDGDEETDDTGDEETPDAGGEGTGTDADEETTTQTGPGFGIAVSLIALIGAALLAIRRKE